MKRFFALILSTLFILPFFSIRSYALDYDLGFQFDLPTWKSLSDDEKQSQFKFAVENNGGILPDNISVSGNLGDALSYDFYSDLIDPTDNDYKTRVKGSLQAFGLANFQIDGGADFGSSSVSAEMGKYEYNHAGGGASGSRGRGKIFYSVGDRYLTYDITYDTPAVVYNQSYLYGFNDQPIEIAHFIIKLYSGGVLLDSEKFNPHYLNGENNRSNYPYKLTSDSSAVWDFHVTDYDSGYATFSSYGWQHQRLEPVSGSGYQLPLWIGSGGFTPSGSASVGSIKNLNGNFYIDDNGVTDSDGNNYPWNSDGSVTIDNRNYYISPDFSTYNDEYINNFYDSVVNNYYGSGDSGDSGDTGDTNVWDVLKEIVENIGKTIQSIIETFGTTLQTGIDSLSNTLASFFDNIPSVFERLSDTLDKILSFFTDFTQEQMEEERASWVSLIDKIKKKFDYDDLMTNIDNIQTYVFGARTVSMTEDSIQVSYIDSSGDVLVTDALPHAYFEYNGEKYDIFYCLSFIPANLIETVRNIISFFLVVSFVISVYRTLPTIIGGVSGYQTAIDKISRHFD